MTEKAALLDSVHPAADEVFEAAGLEVVRFSKAVSTGELADIASDVQVLGVRSGPKVPGEVFDGADNLLAVGCYSVGHGHIDSKTAAHRGIPVFNSAFENTRAVAEYVVGSVFSLLRRFPEHNASMHDGVWTKTDERSYEVLGKTVGVIGYGATGSQAASMLELLGMSVIFYDPHPKIPKHSRAERVESMDKLLSQADVVTIHVPGGQTVMTAEAISWMKPGSYLINTSRGEAVDDEAVVAALQSGQLAGYAADVYRDEPSNKGDLFQHKLRDLKNALLTPHIAGSSQEAQLNIGVETSRRLIGYLATGTTLGAVNVGEVAMGPIESGTTRLAQFHRNVPGAAQAVDGVFANYSLNIDRQRLETKNGVGYVISDVEPEAPQAAIDAVRALEHTIRLRHIA
jgi:D-3-phosphoglycerate dehydrogenase